jgi:hypothetical protein
LLFGLAATSAYFASFQKFEILQNGHINMLDFLRF